MYILNAFRNCQQTIKMSETISFKKSNFKNRGSRKRQASSSEEGNNNQHYSLSLRQCYYFLEKSHSDNETTVIKPSHRKQKSNPNVQSTSKNVKKTEYENYLGDNEEDEGVTVNYKSNRSAAPAGPSDQGATAILVNTRNILLYSVISVLFNCIVGNRDRN